MAANGAFRNPSPLSDLLSGILDPVLRKRAGISLALVQSWEEIVGSFAASRSRPDKVIWPRGKNDHHGVQGATLVIACDASAALELQHETSEIIARVNGFLGSGAVGRIRLVQKAVAAELPPPRPVPRPLTDAERGAISRMTGGIEDESLRLSLERLGATIKGQRGRPIKST